MNACVLLNISKKQFRTQGDNYINFTYARAQKATARNIHGNVPE